MKTKIVTNQAPAPVGPYNQAIVANGMVYTAGQVSIDPSTNELIHVGDVEAQTRRVLDSLAAILESAGSSLNKVVKTTVFLKDMNDFGAMNAVYAEYFTDIAPARSTVEVSRLPKDVLVEIDCIGLI